MPRSSRVHYIPPNGLSIIPNCNESADDLSVAVTRGTKIKVYSPAAGIDTKDDTYQEWTLTGRNRRLADSNRPYTIYARISKTEKKAYLVFAAQTLRDGIWTDKYSSVTPNGLSVLYVENGFDVINESMTDWYVNIGYVTLPEANKRKVVLDTGILGTDKYNEDIRLNPDDLPFRIELSCIVGGKDVGANPYLFWGEYLTLTATLAEGWQRSNTVVSRWTITRNTGSASADDAWNYPSASGIDAEQDKESQARRMVNGQIVLAHTRVSDDFFGTVAPVFTVSAWRQDGTNLVLLVKATITIMAEVSERYELTLSSNIVRFDPTNNLYIPSEGIHISVRAIDQGGHAYIMTPAQLSDSKLFAEYANTGENTYRRLTFSGLTAATTNIPVSAFTSERGVVVRLMRSVTSSSSDDLTTTEMHRATIAFVRDGRDGDSAQIDEDIIELLEDIDNLDTGNENLLRNSAFAGEWVDEEPTATEIMKDTDEMWSRHIKYWTVENVTIRPSSDSASATTATLSDGSLKQTVVAAIEEGATYCFSLRGRTGTVKMSFAGAERDIQFDEVMTRQTVKFVALTPELNVFTLTGTGTITELMLNKGSVPNTDWVPSPFDNPRAIALYKSLAYMTTSIFEASTDILGGLVLTQMLKVGNYRDKVMIEETGGMSGLMTSPHSPYLWGGGTLEQAFDTIAKYAQNPRYQPTQEELSQMAQFVVTHGGRAILNEAIVRGTIYATNGVFKGRVEASEGEFHGKVVASEGEFHGKIYADEGEFGGLVYTPWKWYFEADGNRFYKENTVIYTFKDVGDDISNDLNIIFGNDSIGENTKNIMFYVSLPTSPKYANKTIKIFSPDYFYDTLNIHKEVFNGVSVSMPTITPSSFGNLRSAPFIYGLSCEDDSDHYRATSIEFDTGILSLSSIIVPDLFAEGGERCAWYVESFTYRRAVITGDGGVKWGNGRGNFGGKKT